MTWPRWRKRWKALHRAQSPIMLSLNLPQIPDCNPHAITADAADVKRRPYPARRAAPQIGGTMPKSHPRRNAAEALNRRFQTVFRWKPALVHLARNPQKWL